VLHNFNHISWAVSRCETIIHIPTQSNSNEVKSIVVVFIPCQLTLGRVVERCRDHIQLLHDFPNSTTLVQKVVASSVFLVTEILAIEHHKLHSTFLHIAFRSQSLLKPTSDQISSDTNWRIGEGDQRGGVNGSQLKIPRRNLAYVPKSIRHASLLARLRLHGYRKAIGPWNQVRQLEITAEDDNQCMEGHEWNFDDQNQTNCLTHISSNTSWAWQINHEWITKRLRKTWAFDLMAQEQYQNTDRSIKSQFEHSTSRTQRNREA
jgi:hypothetical protein